MNRILLASVAALLGLSVTAWAGGTCGSCCGGLCHCQEGGPCCEKDCDCPCGHFRIPALMGACHVQHLLDKLCSGDCCERIKAARCLGCRLHADFCCNQEILPALGKALMSDSCWEVRKAAAWAIAYQGARTDYGMLVLYLAWKLDPHFLVRDSAHDALEVLIVCRRSCFCDLFKQADELVKRIRPLYRPTTGHCVELIDGFCAEHGIRVEAAPHGPAVVPVAPPVPPAAAPAAGAAMSLPMGTPAKVVMTSVGKYRFRTSNPTAGPASAKDGPAVIRSLIPGFERNSADSAGFAAAPGQICQRCAENVV